MPKVDKSETPATLKPYYFQGVILNWSKGDDNAYGECPWCGSDKFSVRVEDGLWQCWVCGEGGDKGGGNTTTFLRLLQAKSFEATTSEDYEELAASRGISVPTLVSWGVCRSIVNKNWLVPAGCSKGSDFTQLYRWVKTPTGHNLLPTPTMGSYMFGHSLLNKKNQSIFICEGPWDAMTLWEFLKETGTKKTSVIGVPGVNNFHESWFPYFYKKKVNIAFDSDHPKVRCKSCRKTRLHTQELCVCGSADHFAKLIEPPGLRGVKRIAGLLNGCANPPVEINFCEWGPDGYDPTLPSGTDARDYLTGKC